jgi:hypothetical protein
MVEERRTVLQSATIFATLYFDSASPKKWIDLE